MSFTAAALKAAENIMLQQLNESLYKDHDPWNTEWRNAIWEARKHYRKRRRKFFDLWLEVMRANRKEPMSGLAARYVSLSGGAAIQNPVTYTIG